MSAGGQVGLPSYMTPPVAAPTAPSGGGTGGRGTITGGVYAPATSYPPVSGGGFAGTTGQSTTAATLAGMPNNSPGWVAAQGAANANGGVLPGQAPPVQSSPFDSDPGYAAQLAAEQAGIPSINNNLNNLIAQRIVAYGDPSLAAQAGFGLDPQAAAFARQNYLSGNGQLARLDKSHEQARRSIINQLAAHGLIDSGDTGYQIGNADQGYGNQVYDAQQQALADILGYRNNAQTQLSNLHQQTISALQNAFTNYANNPAAYGQVSTTPPAVTSITPPQTPTVVRPPKAVVKALVNPYTTGQKRFG